MRRFRRLPARAGLRGREACTVWIHSPRQPPPCPFPRSPRAPSSNRPPLESTASSRVCNPDQRAAACHGLDGSDGGPLLIIAGAGTGKTNTLAHRVAYLSPNGADPRADPAADVPRRAAAEMTRRVERILAEARRPVRARRAPSAALGRHLPRRRRAAAARVRRAHRPRPGVHDPRPRGLRGPDRPRPRTSSASPTTASASRPRAPASRSTRAPSTPGAARRGAGASAFPWCAQWEAELRRLFAAYVAAKQAQNVLDYDDLLLYWAQMMAEPALAGESASASTTCWSTSTRTPTACRPRSCSALKPDGRGLTVVGDDAQAIYSFRAATVRNILDFPAQFTPPARIVTLERNYRSTQADPRRRQRGDRARPRALHQEPVDATARRTNGRSIVAVRDEADQARYVVEQVLERREAGDRAEVAGRAVPHLEPQRGCSNSNSPGATSRSSSSAD